jgi:hypothetical protein
MKLQSSAFLAVTLLVLADPAAGQSPEGEVLGECYIAQAFVYGQTTCHAPSEVLQAIFGKCAEEERAALSLIDDDSSVRSAVLAGVRAIWAPEVQAVFLDAQISSARCRISN